MIPSNYTAVSVVALIAVLGVLAGLQIALAAGAPFGRFAWGGTNRVLPSRQRVGSLVSVAIYSAIALLVLDRVEQFDLVPDLFSRVGMWIVCGYFALSIGLNSMSRSRAERLAMVPASALLTVLSLTVALA
jgi:hypothetical protein